MSCSFLISIIIPCYNQSTFLKETINSLQNQTYSNWEAIIVNDGSTDDCTQILEELCKEDTRITVIHQKNGGLSSARNRGLENINGEFIQFLDADDKLTPNKFQDAIDIFKKSNPDIVISNFLRFKSRSGKIKKAFCDLRKIEYTFENILTKWDVKFSIPIHCAIFSKKAIGKTSFNTTLKAKEDWKFWIDIYEKKPKTIFINHNSALYRIHKKSMTKNPNFMLKNKEIANMIIYNSLKNDKDKVLFFNRINKELNKANLIILKLKYNAGLKKWYYKLFR